MKKENTFENSEHENNTPTEEEMHFNLRPKRVDQSDEPTNEAEKTDPTSSEVEDVENPLTEENSASQDSTETETIPETRTVEPEHAQEIHIQGDSDEEIQTLRKHRNTHSSARNVWESFKRSVVSEFKPIHINGNTPVERRKQHVIQLRRQRGAAGSLLLLHALLSILFYVLWAAFPREILGIDKFQLNGALFSTLCLQAITILLPSVIILLLYNMDMDLIIGRKVQNLVSYLLAILIGIPAALVFTGLNNITLFILYQLGFHPISTNILGQVEHSSWLSLLIIILATALVPAISEELMFRGVIQTSLSLSGRSRLAIFLSATAFSLFHANPYFIVAPFVAGVYLGFIRHKSDNLYQVMIIHFVMNTSLLLIQPTLPTYSSSTAFVGSSGQSMFFASLIATIVAAIVLIPLTNYFLQSLRNAKEINKDPIYKRLQQEQWFPADWKFMLGLFLLFTTIVVLRS